MSLFLKLCSVFICSLLLLSPLASRADLPDLGDSSALALSAAEEAHIGAEMMRALRAEGLINDDDELAYYLTTLGNKLANTQPITFFIVNDPTINAFALPGGYVGIHSGLILFTQSEGELAAVLSHEIAHITQKHIARMQAKSTPNQLLLLATVVAAALASRTGNADAVAGSISAGLGLIQQNQLTYSQDFEREADRVGMQYMTAAGFDARNMSEFFLRLSRKEKENGATNAYEFLRTHPLTSQRISDAENRAQNTPVQMNINSTEYLLVREKIRLIGMDKNTAIKYYDNALQQGLYLNEGAQWYGLAQAYLMAHSPAHAKTAWQNAQKKLSPDPMLYSLEASIWYALGKQEKKPKNDMALLTYQKGLERFPNNWALSIGEINLLINEQNTAAALAKVNVLLTQQQRQETNKLASQERLSTLFRIQAKIYVDHDKVRYHDALGNALYIEQRYAEALEQYKMAEEALAPNQNFYLRSSIEARINELEIRGQKTEDRRQK